MCRYGNAHAIAQHKKRQVKKVRARGEKHYMKGDKIKNKKWWGGGGDRNNRRAAYALT